ncbi:hypothetical protein AB6805_30400 [Chitinophaga sp. RCC_12]|uniref:hypothetical protein n=1 Tax=Chitinophaga sp. RCC_12 TaxID=3239226 RepID=UPI003523F8BD
MTAAEIKQAAIKFANDYSTSLLQRAAYEGFTAGSGASKRAINMATTKPVDREIVLAFGRREGETIDRWHTAKFYAEDEYNKECWSGFNYVTHWTPMLPSPLNQQP